MRSRDISDRSLVFSVREMTTIMKQVILNPSLVAINQDHLAPAGYVMTFSITLVLALPGDVDIKIACAYRYETKSCGNSAWVRHLSNGSTAVAVVNMADSHADVQVSCLLGLYRSYRSISHVPEARLFVLLLRAQPAANNTDELLRSGHSSACRTSDGTPHARTSPW